MQSWGFIFHESCDIFPPFRIINSYAKDLDKEGAKELLFSPE